MGQKVSKKDYEEHVKFNLTDKDDSDTITMEEFEQIYVQTSGKRPSCSEWKKFHMCDTDNDFIVSKGEFLKFIQQKPI